MFKPAGITRTAIMSLCFGLAVASAQPGEHGKPNGKSEKQARREAPQRPQRQDRDPRGERGKQPVGRIHTPSRDSVEHGKVQAVAWQNQRGWLKNGGWRGHESWQKNRAKHWALEHRTWAQRGGYGGYRIPHERFVAYFGPAHFFRIHTRPVIYMGYPRFMYGGFSFLLVDPWPEYWAESWYESDDVYIDYEDGYYLYNRKRPGVRLAITIAL